MREVKFWEFLTKVYLKYYEEVQLIAMGRAIHLAVRASNNILKKELAEYTKIETFIAQEVPRKKSKKSQLKPSIKIIVKKVDDFEMKIAKLQLIEDQNDQHDFQ